jgi:hypothetical protein
MDKTAGVIIGISVLVLAVIIGWAVVSEKNYTPNSACIEHSASLAMHIHPHLQIIINGQPVTIPANIGISSSCMHPVHTHDDTGEIHVESPERVDLQLKDFFTNWGQTFNKNEIMGNKVDDKHTLTMTVNGRPSTDYENLVLKDGQQIVIDYEAKK